MRHPSRREFLKSSSTAVCAAGLGGVALANSLTASAPTAAPLFPPTLSIKKGVWFEMLPAKLSIGDRFKLARDVGFEVAQVPTQPDESKVEEIKKAAEAANIRIDSVMNMDHWKYPLSSSDRAVARRQWIFPVIHVHHGVDADVRGFGGLLDLLGLALVRLCRHLGDLETDVLRQFEAVRGAQLRGQHFVPNAFLDGECWRRCRSFEGSASHQRVRQRSAAE